ncbi:phage holin family protein [Orbus wheelerorum]|uniref:phage holin family protein n=1 Tax=Orbus wheelerorum TaxID=3074111 RepID=UPI00370DAEB0
MDKYSSPISYFWGALCTLLGALSLNDIAMIIGILLSIATFIINWIYRRRDFLHKKKLREEYYAKYNQDNNRRDL